DTIRVDSCSKKGMRLTEERRFLKKRCFRYLVKWNDDNLWGNAVVKRYSNRLTVLPEKRLSETNIIGNPEDRRRLKVIIMKWYEKI
ncbi:hypothetical protein NPIL_81951, partial [Nephila pilipes]